MLRLIDALPAEVNDYIHLPQLGTYKSDSCGRVALFPKAGNDVKEWGDKNFYILIQLLALEPDVSSISVYTTSSVETAQYKKLSDAKIKVLQSLPYAELIEC